PLGTHYVTSPFSVSTTFDLAYRVTAQSTGADVPELLGKDAFGDVGDGSIASRSTVTATYGVRGFVQSVQGSYGTLIEKSIVDADGALRATIYGDAAHTSIYRCYD